MLSVLDERIAANGDDNRLHPKLQTRLRISTQPSPAAPIGDSKISLEQQNHAVRDGFCLAQDLPSIIL
jgi:hypothetical protein